MPTHSRPILNFKLVHRHPELLEMELDVMYTHIGSSPVVASFSALAKRIANKELPHGADIIVGIHSRLLDDPHPLQLKLVPAPSASFGGRWGEVKEEGVEVKARDTLEDEDEDPETGSHVGMAVRPTSPVYPSQSMTPASILPSSLVERASPPAAKGNTYPGGGTRGAGRPQGPVAASNLPPPRSELGKRNGAQTQASQNTVRFAGKLH